MHRDSGGHESVIRAGGVQWMTAGSGLVHAELSPDAFKRAGGPLEILQLWVNLPSRLKMTTPRYQGLQADAIPVVEAAGGKARVSLIAGAWGGVHGPGRVDHRQFHDDDRGEGRRAARLRRPRGPQRVSLCRLRQCADQRPRCRRSIISSNSTSPATS